MLAVEDVVVEERVQTRIEEWVVEIAGDDQLEEALEGRHSKGEIRWGEGEAVAKEVHEDLGTAEGGENGGVLKFLEQCFLLWFGHGRR